MGMRERRRELGLTQVDLAGRLGISQSAVAQFEKYVPKRQETRDKIAAALETTAAELFDEAET